MDAVRHHTIGDLLHNRASVPDFLAELVKTVPVHGNAQPGLDKNLDLVCHAGIHALEDPVYVDTVLKAKRGGPTKHHHIDDDDCMTTLRSDRRKHWSHYAWQRNRTGPGMLARRLRNREHQHQLHHPR